MEDLELCPLIEERACLCLCIETASDELFLDLSEFMNLEVESNDPDVSECGKSEI